MLDSKFQSLLGNASNIRHFHNCLIETVISSNA